MKLKLPITICVCSGLTISVAASPAHADELSDLQAQLNSMSAAMAQLKAEQAKLEAAEVKQKEDQQSAASRQTHIEQMVAAQNAAAQRSLQQLTPTSALREGGLGNTQYVTKGKLPGSFLIPGTNTSVRIGGFINVQGIYDPTQDFGPKFSIGNLEPNSPSRQAGADDFHFQSKNTRLIVQTSTPSELGPITTDFAFDLYGYVNGGDNTVALQNNADGLRGYMAYGTVGPMLLGLTWSNFVDLSDQGETFDSAGPAGIPSERIEQIRYTFTPGKSSVFSVSAEDPQGGYMDTQGAIEAASPTNPMPDFTANYQIINKIGHLQISGSFRDLAFTDMHGNRTSIYTGAGIVGATLNLASINKGFGKDNLGGQIWFGGLGRYIPDDFGGNVASIMAVDDGTSAHPTGAKIVKLQMDQGFTAYVQHYWTLILRSSVSIGYNHQNLASFLPANVANAVATETIHVNLIVRPAPNVDLGVEAMYGQKTFQKSTDITPKDAERVEIAGIWHY